MIRLLIFSICISFFFSCKKPYGQNPLVQEDFPDSLVYPQINEIEDNDDPFQYYRLARIRYNQGEVAEAVDYTREAIALDDENALYYYLLAQLLSEQGKQNEALDNALKSYSLGYVNPDLQVLISKLYYEAGEQQEGEKFLNVAIRKRPRDPELRFLQSQVHLQNHDTVLAIKWLDKTLALDSGFIDAYLEKANIYIAQDSLNAAIDNYEKVIQHRPQDKENLFTLAALEMKAGDQFNAELRFRQLLGIDSANTAAYLQLAQIMLDQRQFDSARYYSGRALKFDNGFNNARLLIARSYDRQYRYSQALQTYKEIVQRDSTFDIAIIEMEVLEKKIAYLRRMREQQDTVKTNTPAPIDTIKNSEN